MKKDFIKNDLIEKAYELGFVSYFGKMFSVNKDCYYLWMCDLQKWLIEKYKIYAYVIVSSAGLFPEIFCKNRNITIDKIYSGDEYIKCLEIGLQEAIKLINQ